MKKEIDLSEMCINLRELWTTSYDKLPDWIDSENVIYKIENLINGKVYIGQAKWFYDRFIKSGFSHLNTLISYCKLDYRGTHLYNSLRKYHSRNFEVSIIDILETSEELNNKEIERITEFNSLDSGYNETSGGDNCDHLHTPESRAKAKATIASRYNGDCAGQLHTSKATAKAQETNRRNHNGQLAWSTSEAIEKATETRRKVLTERYGSYTAHMNTVEAVQARMESNKRNHGGVLSWNTPEIEFKAKNSRIINFIIDIIKYIRNWHPELDNIQLTEYLYWYHCDLSENNFRKHVKRVLLRLDSLRLDSRWTPEMDNIYSYFINHREEFSWLN